MPITASMQHADAAFRTARREHHALTAAAEKRLLVWMAEHAPAWVTSDGLTLVGFAAQLGAGAAYALARYDRRALLAGVVCLALNWLGDSLDGTLARVRNQQRPRYGFYVDHMADVLGTVALMAGLGWSGLAHASIAIAMLVAFLVLACESYLATYTLGSFHLSQGWFGPTEMRLLLVAANVAAWRNPWSSIFGHRVLLFDLGGAIGAACMMALALVVAARHTAELYRQEPLA